jgi:transporter family-2 protein
MKISSQMIFLIMAVGAGMMVPFKNAMNSQLGKQLENPYFSTLIIFTLAVIGMGSFIFLSKQNIPNFSLFLKSPWWCYFGGILGGIYILLIILCAPQLGIGNATILILFGQIVSAVVIDQFGLLNSPVHPVNWQRLTGVLCVALGVYLVKRF